MAVKLGIIGPGHIAKVFAKAAKMCDNAELYGVASRDIDRSKKFAEEFGIPNTFGSYDDILRDEKVEAVYIATPHNSHYELTKAALNSGKAVICEKPFVLKSEEVKELSTLAKEKNLLLMEAMWTRLLPTNLKAHQWINEGKIGDIKLIEASFSFFSQVNPEGRLYNKELAGGAMYDVGVYVTAFALDFAGAQLEKANYMTVIGETNVDEISLVNMKFKNGALANLSSGIRANTKQDARIHGTKGIIELPLFWGGTKAILYDNTYNIVEEFNSGYEEIYDGFKFEIAHFCELFQNGEIESPIIPHSYNLQITEIFEEFFNSVN